MDVEAIISTISAITTPALKTAFSPQNLASLLDSKSPTPVVTRDPTEPVEQAVDDDVNVITYIHTYIHTLLARPHGAFQSQFYITKL